MSDDGRPKFTQQHLDTVRGYVKSKRNEARARQVIKGKVYAGHGKNPPNHFCPICGVVHTPTNIPDDDSMKEKICSKCQAKLDEAQIAIVSDDDRFAFVYSTHLAGHGPIIKVSKQVMDAVEKEYKVTAAKQEPDPSLN